LPSPQGEGIKSVEVRKMWMSEGFVMGRDPVPLALCIENDIEVIPHPNKFCAIRKASIALSPGRG
jgi:hypothetical protein